MTARLSRNDRLRNVFPSIRTVHIAGAQGAAFRMTKLVERKQGMMAHAAEMPIPARALLCAMGRAERTVHVERDPFGWRCRVNPVDPAPRQISQGSAIAGRRQHLGPKPSHLACGRGLCFTSPPAGNLAHHRIKRQTIRVIYILVSGQPTEDRPPQQANQQMQTVVASAPSRNTPPARS